MRTGVDIQDEAMVLHTQKLFNPKLSEVIIAIRDGPRRIRNSRVSSTEQPPADRASEVVDRLGARTGTNVPFARRFRSSCLGRASLAFIILMPD